MMNDQQQPASDSDGITWYPTESAYAAPDRVAQQPPTTDLSDLRPAVERGERVHWRLDETGFGPDGSLAGQRKLSCNTVIVAPQLLRKEHDRGDEEDP